MQVKVGTVFEYIMSAISQLEGEYNYWFTKRRRSEKNHL